MRFISREEVARRLTYETCIPIVGVIACFYGHRAPMFVSHYIRSLETG